MNTTKLATLTLAIALSGCSTHHQKNLHTLQLDQPVYGNLQRDDQGWFFANISRTSKAQPKGYVVNLNTGKPIGVDTGTYKCYSMFWSAYKGKNPCKRGEFRNADMNLLTAPGYLIGGAFTFGLIWLAGAAPLESNFHWDDYEDALDQAYSRSDLTKSDFQAAADKLSSISEANQQISATCGQISTNYHDTQNRYQRSFKQQALNNIRSIDASGLLPTQPKNWESYVTTEVTINDHSPLTKLCNKFQYPVTKITANKKGVTYLQEKLNAVNKYQQRARDFVLRKKRAFSDGSFAINCPSSTFKGKGKLEHYYVKASCPKSIPIKDGKLAYKPKLKFTVTGRDFLKAMPKVYHSNDKNLHIQQLGRTVKLTNKSDKYLAIEKLSLYFNSKISTFDANYSMPPHSVKTININAFDENYLNNSFFNVTRQQAKNTIVNYGISALYKASNGSSNHSLHKLKKYNLLDIAG